MQELARCAPPQESLPVDDHENSADHGPHWKDCIRHCKSGAWVPVMIDWKTDRLPHHTANSPCQSPSHQQGQCLNFTWEDCDRQYRSFKNGAIAADVRDDRRTNPPSDCPWWDRSLGGNVQVKQLAIQVASVYRRSGKHPSPLCPDRVMS